METDVKRAVVVTIYARVLSVHLWGVGGRVVLNMLVGYLIVLVSQSGFVDSTIPLGLGRRQHKQNAIIGCILSREKILDIAFEAPFSFIDITSVIFVYIRVYKKGVAKNVIS